MARPCPTCGYRMRLVEGDALSDMACVNPDCRDSFEGASVDYFKRAQTYEDTADKLAAMGCHQSAKRAREKAAYWDKRGTQRMHTLEIAFTIRLLHGNFMHRVQRKRRMASLEPRARDQR